MYVFNFILGLEYWPKSLKIAQIIMIPKPEKNPIDASSYRPISLLPTTDVPDFRRIDWANFQTHLEDQTPFDPELHNGMAIDTCVENFSSAILKALAASSPKRRPRGDQSPPSPTGIQEEIRLKNRLRRQWQVTRDPSLRAEVNRLQRSVTRRLNEWKNDQWSATLESLDPEDQSLWRMTKRVMRERLSSNTELTLHKTIVRFTMI